MISPEAQALAEAQAALDRELLARLLREGRVARQDGLYEAAHPEVARPFVSSVTRLSGDLAHAGVNLAIRPRKNKRKKRR